MAISDPTGVNTYSYFDILPMIISSSPYLTQSVFFSVNLVQCSIVKKKKFFQPFQCFLFSSSLFILFRYVQLYLVWTNRSHSGYRIYLFLSDQCSITRFTHRARYIHTNTCIHTLTHQLQTQMVIQFKILKKNITTQHTIIDRKRSWLAATSLVMRFFFFF